MAKWREIYHRTKVETMKQIAFTVLAAVLSCSLAEAQEMPADYAGALKTVGKQGDFKDGVLKVNIPRSDLKVTVDGIAVPTPFGFGGWIALTKGSGGMDVMMGDLVLTEQEVNPVMSAVLQNGLEVTALHNHFFYDTPRIFYMHIHGHGMAADLATKIAPAIALIGKGSPAPGATGRALTGSLNTQRLVQIIGQAGEQSGEVYKITIARPDLPVKEMGATINARMGLNTWAAFYGSDTEAVVAGDIAMTANEVTPVLTALREGGIEVVAIHHHMTATEPAVYFLHYWGKGPAEKLATGVKAAISKTGGVNHTH